MTSTEKPQEKNHWLPNTLLHHHIPGYDHRNPMDRLDREFPDGGPERLAELVKEIKQDLAGFLDLPEPPAPVAAARGDLERALAQAQTALDDLEKARDGVVAARQADVEAATRALKSGKGAPTELQVQRAREQEEAVLIRLQAHEQLLLEAHRAFTEAARESWPTWRRALVAGALAADAKTRSLVEELKASLEERRSRLSVVLHLDKQVTDRYSGLRKQVQQERRQGIDWFEAAVRRYFSAHLRPDRFKREVLPLVAQLTRHLDEPTPWLTEWTPPSDPEHEEMLSRRLDPEAAWVRSHVFDNNALCPVCGLRVPEDARLDPETLTPIHEGCMGRRAKSLMSQLTSGPSIGFLVPPR